MAEVQGIIPGGGWRLDGAEISAVLVHADTGDAVKNAGVVTGTIAGRMWSINLTANDTNTRWRILSGGKASQSYIVHVPEEGTHQVGDLGSAVGKNASTAPAPGKRAVSDVLNEKSQKKAEEKKSDSPSKPAK